MSGPYDMAIVGGGAYGCHLAIQAAGAGKRVLVAERGPELLQRASFVNQARVHQGYHYPRSLVTALRSRIDFPRFVADYRECIDDSFVKLYAVARIHSKVTARQFFTFCERIGAPIKTAAEKYRRAMSRDFIEDVYEVTEFAFNADILRAEMWRRLRDRGVDVRLNTEASRITPGGDALRLGLRAADSETEVRAREVYNCTYSRLNRLLRDSGLTPVKLKHELTELALVEPPPILQGAGLTVMCGPFFSIMPFPARACHSFSHVRYTPHCQWFDAGADPWMDPYDFLAHAPLRPAYLSMLKDAVRYVPAMKDTRYRESIWEIKTVLPQSEVDDSRPILLRRSPGAEGVVSVLGSKIDNIYEL